MSKYGFTLVELAIVLVIIALIVGAVVAGRELVEQAKLNNYMSNFGKYERAALAFRLKYNYLPGDIKATNFGLTNYANGITGAAGNGNQDGKIETNYEILNEWHHLEITDFVSSENFVADGVAKGPLLDSLGIPSVSGYNAERAFVTIAYPSTRDTFPPGHWMILDPANWITNYTAGMDHARSVLTTLKLYEIDKKLDDGLPFSGSVRSVGRGYGYVSMSPTTANDASWRACVNVSVSPAVYNTVNNPTVPRCDAAIKMGF